MVSSTSFERAFRHRTMERALAAELTQHYYYSILSARLGLVHRNPVLLALLIHVRASLDERRNLFFTSPVGYET